MFFFFECYNLYLYFSKGYGKEKHRLRVLQKISSIQMMIINNAKCNYLNFIYMKISQK